MTQMKMGAAGSAADPYEVVNMNFRECVRHSPTFLIRHGCAFFVCQASAERKPVLVDREHVVMRSGQEIVGN